MKKILVIAKNTFKETIRDRILYGIVIFSVIFLASTTILGSLSLGEDMHTIRNFGLAGIYLFGLIVTVFLGASLVYKEVDKKTIYFVLSKPVESFHVILGKFLGLLVSIAVTILVMALVYLGVLAISGGGFDYLAILAILMQICEIAVLISILILLSIFSAPLAATIYTILIIYIGHLLSLFLEYARKSDGLTRIVLKMGYYLLPNLEKFNIRNLVVHNIRPSWEEAILSIGYASLYSALALYVAVALFKKKEL